MAGAFAARVPATIRFRRRTLSAVAAGLILSLQPESGASIEPITLTVMADQPGPKIDPIFYGLMTEEINYSYDGGLYGELTRNRIFQDRLVPPRPGRGGAPPPASAPAPANPEEIEYIAGPTSTKWGARRARHGHPAPFKLRYVEIGNEDFLNNGMQTYAGRFAMFGRTRVPATRQLRGDARPAAAAGRSR